MFSWCFLLLVALSSVAWAVPNQGERASDYLAEKNSYYLNPNEYVYKSHESPDNLKDVFHVQNGKEKKTYYTGYIGNNRRDLIKAMTNFFDSLSRFVNNQIDNAAGSGKKRADEQTALKEVQEKIRKTEVEIAKLEAKIKSGL